MNQPGSPPHTPPQLKVVAFRDDLFDHLDKAVTLSNFCNQLHWRHFQSLNYGIASIQHRKGLYNNSLHEFIILDVVPLISGTNNPQINPSHRYIKVSRSQRANSESFLGMWRLPQDNVVVLLPEDDAAMFCRRNHTSQGNWYPPSELLETLFWEHNIPGLLDMFSLILCLSLSLPEYNRFTSPCYWLAPTAYTVARQSFPPQAVLEAPGNKLWKIARSFFYIPSRLLAAKPPVGLSGFCDRLYSWNDCASREWQQELEQ
ncbi:hypothetical protein OG21DRAFT_413097 [Imleria badia]|nr:hypothetical protein OG21DRAFT_413097 [Imleria badia]